jgi:hypothetical protein
MSLVVELELSELSSQSTHGATSPSIAAELLWGDGPVAWAFGSEC